VNTEMIAEIVRKDRSEWELLTAILDAHPEEILHAPDSPPWVSRDVYAHLARWIEHSNKTMKAYCEGRRFPQPTGTDKEINSRWQQEDSWMTLTEASRRAHEAFEQRLRIIQSIPLDRWDKELERISHYDGAEHLSAHRSYIRLT